MSIKKPASFREKKRKLGSIDPATLQKEKIFVYKKLYKESPVTFFILFKEVSSEKWAKKMFLKIKPAIVIKHIKHIKSIKWIDKYLLKVRL